MHTQMLMMHSTKLKETVRWTASNSLRWRSVMKSWQMLPQIPIRQSMSSAEMPVKVPTVHWQGRRELTTENLMILVIIIWRISNVKIWSVWQRPLKRPSLFWMSAVLWIQNSITRLTDWMQCFWWDRQVRKAATHFWMFWPEPWPHPENWQIPGQKTTVTIRHQIPLQMQTKTSRKKFITKVFMSATAILIPLASSRHMNLVMVFPIQILISM